MSKGYEDFKKRVLFKAIHDEERSDYFYNLMREAETIVSMKRDRYGENGNSYLFFKKMAGRIVYKKHLLSLCDELQSQGYELKWLVQREKDSYQKFFKDRISRARKVMRGLRPYILVAVSEWDEERKLKDRNDPEIGQFFKDWYK